MAYETVTLFGVPIVSGRRVGYGKINPSEAREIFLRSALVEGLWRTRHAFFAQNAATRAEAEELQERTRRRDLVVDDQAIFDFYDARVPADVMSGGHFDAWWKQTRAEQPDLLTLTLDDLIVPDREVADLDAFPDGWRVRTAHPAARLPLRARRAAGRGQRHGAAGRPQPARSCAVQLAGAGVAPGTGDGADPLTAEGGAPPVRAGAGVRGPGAGLARGASRTGSRVIPAALGRALRALTGETRRRTGPGTRRRCRRTCE